jgi:hypothetical protein
MIGVFGKEIKTHLMAPNSTLNTPTFLLSSYPLSVVVPALYPRLPLRLLPFYFCASAGSWDKKMENSVELISSSRA